MSTSKRRHVSPDEQHVLEHGHILLLSSAKERTRCDQAIRQHHYLHGVTLVGEHLRYAFVYRGQWLAVATWSSAAFHLKDRDQFIGWSAEQCARRRSLLANNSRLLVMPDCHYPNLISRFMKLMLQRLSEDWHKRWGHPIALVESFVDPNLYQGTAYKGSGWCHLGKTAGWKRDADDFYVKNQAPKQIWVRELVKHACVKLRAPQLPAAWANVEHAAHVRCTAKAAQIRSLMESVEAEVAEFRRAQALAYPLPGLICLMVMAAAQGVVRGPQDLADYAQSLSPAQLRALKFRTDPQSREVRRPGKTTLTRVLHEVDDDQVERALLRWQDQLLGPRQDRIVIVDGKKVRHAGVEIVNAVDSQGRFLGSVVTPAKTNEIPAARQLLRRQALRGKIVVADAMHTQDETAQDILFEGGGDYLLTVKGNQTTLETTLENLFIKQGFSPSPHGADAGAPAGAQSESLEIRFLECVEVTPLQVGFPGARLVARLETRVKRNGKWCREVVYLVSSLTFEELQAQGMLALKRGYWVVESRLHHCLDITLREDQSRVRTPGAARVLGTIRRVVVSLANAAVNRARQKNPKTKCNTRSFQKRFRCARGGRERLHALVFAKSPNVHDLQD